MAAPPRLISKLAGKNGPHKAPVQIHNIPRGPFPRPISRVPPRRLRINGRRNWRSGQSLISSHITAYHCEGPAPRREPQITPPPPLTPSRVLISYLGGQPPPQKACLFPITRASPPRPPRTYRWHLRRCHRGRTRHRGRPFARRRRGRAPCSRSTRAGLCRGTRG